MENGNENGSELFDWMAKMARNRKLLDDFKENPESVLEQYISSPEQRALIMKSVNSSDLKQGFLEAIDKEALLKYLLCLPDMDSVSC